MVSLSTSTYLHLDRIANFRLQRHFFLCIPMRRSRAVRKLFGGLTFNHVRRLCPRRFFLVRKELTTESETGLTTRPAWRQGLFTSILEGILICTYVLALLYSSLHSM